MSIKLTTTIKGKRVELDLISAEGKTAVRSSSLNSAKKKGVTQADIKEAGYAIEKVGQK